LKLWIFAGPFPGSRVHLSSIVPELTSRGHQVKLYGAESFLPDFRVIHFGSQGLVSSKASPIDLFRFKNPWKAGPQGALLDDMFSDPPELILSYFEPLASWCGQELGIPVWEVSNAALSRLTNTKHTWLSVRLNCFYFGQMYSPVDPAKAIPVARILTYSPFYRFIESPLPARTLYPEVNLEWVRPYGFGGKQVEGETMVANNLGRKLDIFAKQEQIPMVDFPTKEYFIGKTLATTGENAYLEDAFSLGIDKISFLPHVDDPETCLNAGVGESLKLGVNFGCIEKLGSYSSLAWRKRKFQDHAWEAEDPLYLHEVIEKG